MKSLKRSLFILTSVISLSVLSVSAQAGGISIKIGSYGHGYHHGHHSYGHGYRSSYYGYHRPVVSYRHYYQPHYGDYGYAKSYRKKHHNSGHYGYRNHSRHGNGHVRSTSKYYR